MATHKSAEKRARASVRKSARNAKTISAVKTTEKKVRVALGASDKATAQTALAEYSSRVMKAAAKGAIHARTAARKISRLAKATSKSA